MRADLPVEREVRHTKRAAAARAAQTAADRLAVMRKIAADRASRAAADDEVEEAPAIAPHQQQGT